MCFFGKYVCIIKKENTVNFLLAEHLSRNSFSNVEFIFLNELLVGSFKNAHDSVGLRYFKKGKEEKTLHKIKIHRHFEELFHYQSL